MRPPLGHDDAASRLRHLYAGGEGPHTLLICGPDGVGRRPLARWLAALLNCRDADPGARPCGRCDSCVRVAAGEHPDVREVAPDATTRAGRSKRRLEIRIDQLVPRPQGDPDPLAPWLEARPRERYRVACIDHAEALNASAANAFLKVLEEPPRWAVIVLIAPAPDALLPTVASRCTALRLGAVDTAAFADLAPHPALRLGLPGPLLEARRDPTGARTASEGAEAFLAGVQGDLLDALDAAEQLARDADGLGAALERLREPLRGLPPAAHARAADALERCEAALDAYAQPSLAVGVLALELRALLHGAA